MTCLWLCRQLAGETRGRTSHSLGFRSPTLKMGTIISFPRVEVRPGRWEGLLKATQGPGQNLFQQRPELACKAQTT